MDNSGRPGLKRQWQYILYPEGNINHLIFDFVIRDCIRYKKTFATAASFPLGVKG
jgi:hypothetical protein